MKPVNTVLILGSSALKIGEAGEFDYSGSQAIKALKEEGIRTILVNPNVATIQTSEGFADEVYFVPVKPDWVEDVIKREKPDAVLLGFGGQTALNCGVELEASGVLKRHGVQVLGTCVETISDTEDRERFVSRLAEIDVPTPRGIATASVDEALSAAIDIGYPCMARVAFALGGLGSGICRTKAELAELATRAFAHTDQLLVEEYLHGWKEVEYEIVRDAYDNCITVCNMENIHPMGIHTGESVVVAPSQTLSNNEYHHLRETAIRCARHLGIVGECNIQYALSPKGDGLRVIEINARLSRSSALASKATGYPLAYVAAKLSLGMSLTQIKNGVTGVTIACFEPALDYVVIKAPRWDLKKFRGVSEKIGSSMKSVGEVMAIGRGFEEALQKSLRMLSTGAVGLVGNENIQFDDLERAVKEPTESHLFAVAEALDADMSVDAVHELTQIDRWFLYRMMNIVETERALKEHNGDLTFELLLRAKKLGFSDEQIAAAVGGDQETIAALRHKMGIRPAIKQIDTLAAEYPAQTNYLYTTYNGQGDDVVFNEAGSVVILGPGAYRIGSSVEFDWCCVNTARALKELGYKTIMINHNPETVSTDYDECNRLYFDELSFETIREIYERENPLGLILSMGGQIPNNLALPCHTARMRVLGTNPLDVDKAENRHVFSRLLEELGVPQPPWQELSTFGEVKDFAADVGYPVLVRPSYVLSGSAMAVALDEGQLMEFLGNASDVSPAHPVVVSKFVEDAKEIDVDAVAQSGRIICLAVSEHVENAGVHSGDATLVLPPQRTYLETMRRIRKIAERVAQTLSINGPFNIQFLAKNNQVMVIECNVRASRSFPFVSKVLGQNFIETATRVIMGRPLIHDNRSFMDLDYVGVKAPQFSFTRLEGADPTLGVEMASTGEVACLGWDFDEAFLKALVAVGFKFPINKILLSSGPPKNKAEFLEGARLLRRKGVEFFATGGTSDYLSDNGIENERVVWPLEEGEPNAKTIVQNGEVDLVINIPKAWNREELTNDYLIRRAAVDFGIPLITNMQLAGRLAEAYSRDDLDLAVAPWSKYVDFTNRAVRD